MLFYVRDRRNAVTKKAVDIVQKESMIMNALGSKGYNNFNSGTKETIPKESLGKKVNDSSAAVTLTDSVKEQSSHKSQKPMDCSKQVNDPVATEFSSLKKDQHNSGKMPQKVESSNGFPISNLSCGDGSLHSTPSFKESNGISLSHVNSVSANGSSQSIPIAPTVVQHESNEDHQNSASRKESDSVAIQTTCIGNQSAGKDLNNTVGKPAESNVLHGLLGETSELAKKNTGEVIHFSDDQNT